MVTFTVNIVVKQPKGAVVTALLNPENFTFWQSGLQKFEVITGKPGEIGSIARLHYIQNGRKHVMIDKLIDSEPGKKYLSRISGKAIIATVETLLEDFGESTRITINWSGQSNILLLRFILPLMKKRLKSQSMAELETFKKLIESRGPDFKEAT